MPRMRGGYIFVDGDSVGEIDWPVLRDREKLAQGGLFFAVISLNGSGPDGGPTGNHLARFHRPA
jgi:mRNA degradation ribonuclease J1/J2